MDEQSCTRETKCKSKHGSEYTTTTVSNPKSSESNRMSCTTIPMNSPKKPSKSRNCNNTVEKCNKVANKKSQMKFTFKNSKTKQTNRGKGKRKNKNKAHFVDFSILGTNARGLKQKKESLENTLRFFNNPSLVSIQETLLRSNEKFLIPRYQTFTKNSKLKGRGLLTAVIENLNAILVSDVDSENDILVVQVDIHESLKIRIINGYAPQEDDEKERVLSFYQSLEMEVENAKENDCLIVIEIDSNAKVGSERIKDDPNLTSKYGKVLIDIVERQSLTIANSLNRCEGKITREQKTSRKLERSIIDYIIVCEKMACQIKKMKIDDERVHVLTKFASKKGIIKRVESDHNILFASFNILHSSKSVPKRKTIFNFKDEEGLKKFYEETSNNSAFIKYLFNSDENLEKDSKKFIKKFMKTVHKCFIKIRMTKSKKQSEDYMKNSMELRTRLKLYLRNSSCKIGGIIAREKLKEIEDDLDEKFADKNARIVEDYIASMTKNDGEINHLNIWKLKNTLLPREYDPHIGKKIR